MGECYAHEECEYNGQPECRLPDSMECPHGVKADKPVAESKTDIEALIERLNQYSQSLHPKLPKGRTRESILHSAKDCVCGARNEDYGTPEDNFSRIADLWRIYIIGRCVAQNVHVELNAEDVAAMMCLLKIGRIAGGSESIDNWVDIAGYAACGGEIMSGGDSNDCIGD